MLVVSFWIGTFGLHAQGQSERSNTNTVSASAVVEPIRRNSTNTLLITPEVIISNTLAHSYRVRSSDKDISIARAQIDQARAQGLPQLGANAQANRYTGLKEGVIGPVRIPAVESRYYAGIGITQPAYTGGRIKSQQESAAFQTRAAYALRRGTESDVTLQALSGYWDWSKAFYALGAAEDAVARMEAQSADIHNRYNAGLATENDVLSTDVLLEQTRLRLQIARRQLELARAEIAFLTGKDLPQNNSPERATVQPPEAPGESGLLATAMQERSERVYSEMTAKSAEAGIRTARADWFPQLSLTARYEVARPNILNIPQRDQWDDDAFAGVTISWNLFDFGLTRARVAQAAARADQARLRQKEIDDEITLQVRQARVNLQDAIDRLALAKRTEQSARRNLQSATDLYNNGLARHSDVLDAHAQLTNAEFEIVSAGADIQLAQAQVDHAVGLLGRGKNAK